MGTNFNPTATNSGFNDQSRWDDILADIRDDLEDKVDRNGVLPNAMAADLDMGTNNLLNVKDGVNGTDGVNLNQVQNLATSIATTILGTGSPTGGTTGDPITFNYGLAVGSQGATNRTVFDLNTLFSVTSFNGLTVVANGVVQIPGLAYSVSGTVVTFTGSMDPDTDIMFIYGDLSPTPTTSLTVNNYDIGVYVVGQPDASEEVIRFVAARDIFLADDFSGSKLNAGTAATAEATWTVWRETGSTGAQTQIGTIVVAASGRTGTFATSGTDETISAGDLLVVKAPSSIDATLADISITMLGARGT